MFSGKSPFFHLIVCSLLMLALQACKKNEKQTIVYGEIMPVATLPYSQVTLIYTTDDTSKNYDSVKTGVDGKFMFTVKHDEATPLFMAIKESGEMALAMLEGDSLELKASIGSFKNVQGKGGKAQAEWNTYLQSMEPYTKAADSINQKAAMAKTDAEITSLNLAMQNMQAQVDDEILNFLKAHSNSLASVLVSYNNSNFVDDHNWINKMYSLLGSEAKNNRFAKRVADRIQKLQNLEVGHIAPDFSAMSSTGKKQKLSDFRGKYVLLDFWASWCQPCRMENPNVVRAYEQYKNNSFTVLGFSLDDSSTQKAWLEAITKDGLAWTHLSELKGWQSDVANLYNIKSIPANFLLDKEGKIVAKDLRADSLHIVLQSLLNKQ